MADKWIEPEQYQGSVGDGVYCHCSVPEKLDELDSQREGHFFRTWGWKKGFVVSKVVYGMTASKAKRGFLL